MASIVVVGDGPHSEMCAAVIASTGLWTVVGHVVPDGVPHPAHLEVVGHDADLPELCAAVPAAFVGIGDGHVRGRLLDDLRRMGFRVPAIIAPSAVIAEGVTIGDGVLVSPGAVVNVGATIKRGAIINTAAVVEHHVVVGECAHIAPNATLCGSVTVGDLALVGAGAVVLPDVAVGEAAVVAAGSAAPRDVPAGVISGVPGRRLR